MRGPYRRNAPGGSVLLPLGEVTLSVDPGFVFTDNSDPENPGWQISAGDFLMSMENRTDSFRPEATVVPTEMPEASAAPF